MIDLLLLFGSVLIFLIIYLILCSQVFQYLWGYICLLLKYKQKWLFVIKKHWGKEASVLLSLMVVISGIALIIMIWKFKNIRWESFILVPLIVGSAIQTFAFWRSDLKQGKEGRIEKSLAFTLLFTFVAIISGVWSDLVDEDTSALNSVLGVASIFAGCVALFGLVIAFLGYKRKSGVAVEVQFTLERQGAWLFYFYNLKDRTIVIHEFVIESMNLEYIVRLGASIVLPAYGTKTYTIEDVSCLFNNRTKEGEYSGGRIIQGNGREEISYDMRIELLSGNYKIRANTSFGEVYFITNSDMIGMSDGAVTSKKGKIVVFMTYNSSRTNSFKIPEDEPIYELEVERGAGRRYVTKERK